METLSKWEFFPSIDLADKAVPEYWKHEDTGEIFYGDNHPKEIRKFFVFDVESIGLHGEAYAVAGGTYGTDGSAKNEFCFSVDPEFCKGNQDDRKWCKDNIPPIKKTHGHRHQMRRDFWELWLDSKEKGALMAADCLWPVEGKFLSQCVNDDNVSRKWEGPYPFVEISSILMAKGIDPMVDYPRIEGELPKHEPLADARQSARLLIEALNK